MQFGNIYSLTRGVSVTVFYIYAAVVIFFFFNETLLLYNSYMNDN